MDQNIFQDTLLTVPSSISELKSDKTFESNPFSALNIAKNKRLRSDQAGKFSFALQPHFQLSPNDAANVSTLVNNPTNDRKVNTRTNFDPALADKLLELSQPILLDAKNTLLNLLKQERSVCSTLSKLNSHITDNNLPKYLVNRQPTLQFISIPDFPDTFQNAVNEAYEKAAFDTVKLQIDANSIILKHISAALNSIVDDFTSKLHGLFLSTEAIARFPLLGNAISDIRDHAFKKSVSQLISLLNCASLDFKSKGLQAELSRKERHDKIQEEKETALADPAPPIRDFIIKTIEEKIAKKVPPALKTLAPGESKGEKKISFKKTPNTSRNSTAKNSKKKDSAKSSVKILSKGTEKPSKKRNSKKKNQKNKKDKNKSSNSNKKKNHSNRQKKSQ